MISQGGRPAQAVAQTAAAPPPDAQATSCNGAEPSGQGAAPARGPAARPQQLREPDAAAGVQGDTGVVAEQTGPAANGLTADVPGCSNPAGGAHSSRDAAAAGQACPPRNGQLGSSVGPAAQLAAAQSPSQGLGQHSHACSPRPARQRAAQQDTAQELPRGPAQEQGALSAAASLETSVHRQGRGRRAHPPAPSTQEVQSPQAQQQPRTRACKRKPVHQLHAQSAGEAVAASDASEAAAEGDAAFLASPVKQPSKRRKVTGSAAASHPQDGNASRPVCRQSSAQSPEVAALKPPARLLTTTRSGRRTTRMHYVEASDQEEQVGFRVRVSNI